MKAYDNAHGAAADRADARCRHDDPDAAERRRQRRRARARGRRGAGHGGTTYIATALAEPGVIEQTGTHRRIVFGEVFGDAAPDDRSRVTRMQQALAGADIQAEAVDDGRIPIWEKFIFLVSLAGVHRRGAAADRADLGRTRSSARSFSTAAARSSVSRAPKACRSRRTSIERICDLCRRHPRIDAVVAADRSVAGKADRGGGAAGRGRPSRRAGGVETPIIATLYAVLKPWASGHAIRLSSASNAGWPASGHNAGSTAIEHRRRRAGASTIRSRCSTASSNAMEVSEDDAEL